MFISVGYYSEFYDETFDLGKSFLSYIDRDTLDLVSVLEYLIVGMSYYI